MSANAWQLYTPLKSKNHQLQSALDRLNSSFTSAPCSSVRRSPCRDNKVPKKLWGGGQSGMRGVKSMVKGCDWFEYYTVHEEQVHEAVRNPPPLPPSLHKSWSPVSSQSRSEDLGAGWERAMWLAESRGKAVLKRSLLTLSVKGDSIHELRLLKPCSWTFNSLMLDTWQLHVPPVETDQSPAGRTCNHL